jgi:hypothetical protein
MKLTKQWRILGLGVVLCLLGASALGQHLSKRLVLKDGSYQLATQWEVTGERVRYLSAERNEWEEVPNSLVDWPATEKYEKDRAAGIPSAEAVALDKELAAERAAEEARSPEVAPGLRLPEDGNLLLLDTYQGEPQLVELQQSNGEIKRNLKGNILRAAVNPIASAKQSIEIPGPHAKVQSHAALPAIYVNVSPDWNAGPPAAGAPAQPELPWDRFKIARVQLKGEKRVVGSLKISVIGKTSQEQTLVPVTAEKLTGNWVKVTPSVPLTPGEYAVVEMLGKDGMNLYVWDFGVNTSAAENVNAIKARPAAPAKLETKPQ